MVLGDWLTVLYWSLCPSGSGRCDLNKLEYLLDEALDDMEYGGDLSQEQIDLIRHTCGKLKRTVADFNKEFLLDEFTEFGNVFCKQ